MLLCVSCGNTDNYNTNDRDGLTIVFAGDVLLSRGVEPIIRRHGVEYLFRDVLPFFRSADFTIVNLECPVTQVDAPLMKKYIFRADDSCAVAIAKSGITHCAFANNHIMDQGGCGLLDTYNNITKAGITPIGYGYCDSVRLQPALLHKDSIKVAVFNDCAIRVENYESPVDGPGIANVPISRLLPVVSDFRRRHPDYYIVAVLHWGIEFREHPAMQQRIEATQMLSAGVDVIVGHHPHVIQDVDTIGGRIVYYSIGNFVFDQQSPLGRKAIMPIVTFKRDTILHKVVNINIKGNCPMCEN